MSYLELQNISIGYKTPLISYANAKLNLGDVCLLIGNNGVGKTTLIKSILHQLDLLHGKIILNQKDIQTLSTEQIAREVAVVFSKAQIPSYYTVRDLISLGKYIHYPYYFQLKQEDLDEVQHIIDDLELQPYQDVLLTNLSDGNLQKAFIGRAIAQNSPILILDEPTTHLDESNKIIILQLLRKLAKQHNKLILFSSHDWRLAKEFSDKIWYLLNKILHSGITEDILNQHQELTKISLFSFSENFKPPYISAPNLETEILYSFLQKNHQKDLSGLKFEFSDGVWLISQSNSQYKASSFAEMDEILRYIH